MKARARILDLSDQVALKVSVSCHAGVTFPSPPLSPAGRGRNIHRALTMPPPSVVHMLSVTANKRAAPERAPPELLASTAAFPLSPRERVRVRGSHAIATPSSLLNPRVNI